MITNIKKISRQLAIAAVCFLIVFSNFTIPVFAKESGKCGNNVSWSLDDGVLIISGRGEMDNYYEGNWAPWYEFRNQIVNIRIKNGVTKIGDTAFYDCDNLKSVSMADSVTSIGLYAFFDCNNLVSVTLSDSINYIGNHSFKNCNSLISIDLPNSLISLGYEAFFGCRSLVSVYVPSSVYLMQECVFTYCTGLIQASIQASIGKLPEWTFYGCESLVSVSLASSILNVGESSFYKCENLNSVTINTSQNNCNNLTNQIKEDVKGFGGVTSVIDGNDLETSWKPDNSLEQKDAIENEDVTLGGSISQGESKNELDINLDATVKNDDGWKVVVDKVKDYSDTQNGYGSDKPINVNVTIKDNEQVNGSILNELAGLNVNLTIKGNVESVISCKELDENTKYEDFSIDYTLEKIEKPTKADKNALGDSEGYYLKFKDDISFKVMIKVPFGESYSMKFVSLFKKGSGKWDLKQSVQIDNNGVATFYLNGFNDSTYLLGIDIKDVDGTNSIIPDSLSGDYGGLTDAYGNRYVITGRDSKWGLDINQVVLIMVIVLVVVVCAVGGSMYIMNKRNIELAMIKEEVFSKSYKMRKNKKK